MDLPIKPFIIIFLSRTPLPTSMPLAFIFFRINSCLSLLVIDLKFFLLSSLFKKFCCCWSTTESLNSSFPAIKSYTLNSKNKITYQTPVLTSSLIGNTESPPVLWCIDLEKPVNLCSPTIACITRVSLLCWSCNLVLHYCLASIKERVELAITLQSQPLNH